MTPPPSSVWVCIETTQEVVTVGLRTILESAAGPFQITTTGPTGDDPDVVLFDVIHMRDGDDSGLDHWLTETASTVIAIAIDRTLRPELGARAKEKGVELADRPGHHRRRAGRGHPGRHRRPPRGQPGRP